MTPEAIQNLTEPDDLVEQDFIVTAHHLTTRFVRVSATSAEEAVALVKEGHGECFDSEPGKDVFRPKWTARPARALQSQAAP
ncbi:MAG: hypothetical protein E6R03_17875 [Hyphomicrobiaceae bacterium]|nr:MAG: hypothetical protein E6R03_17875 [Hyphomicrobiaceae bacterium]